MGLIQCDTGFGGFADFMFRAVQNFLLRSGAQTKDENLMPFLALLEVGDGLGKLTDSAIYFHNAR